MVLYPSQKDNLDAQRQASLDGITDDQDDDHEHSRSIARRIAWGQAVADAILAWRNTDGFTPPPPPFLGGDAVGEWRPNLPGFLPGAGPQFATMTPWVIAAPDQFRPPGPAAVTGAQYAADFNEVKAIGSSTSTTRTASQTEVARFWSGNTPLSWNRIALTMAARRHTGLAHNARLFARLNSRWPTPPSPAGMASTPMSSSGPSRRSSCRIPTATRRPTPTRTGHRS